MKSHYKGYRPKLDFITMVERLEAVKDAEMRQCLACLIWWDFVSIHTRDEYPENVHAFFQPYLDAPPVDPPFRNTVAGLKFMGYLDRYAKERARSPKG